MGEIISVIMGRFFAKLLPEFMETKVGKWLSEDLAPIAQKIGAKSLSFVMFLIAWVQDNLVAPCLSKYVSVLKNFIVITSMRNVSEDPHVVAATREMSDSLF